MLAGLLRALEGAAQRASPFVSSTFVRGIKWKPQNVSPAEEKLYNKYMAKWKRKQFVKSLEEFDGYGAYDPWRHGGRHRPLSNAEMRAMAQEQDDQRRKRRKDKNGKAAKARLQALDFSFLQRKPRAAPAHAATPPPGPAGPKRRRRKPSQWAHTDADSYQWVGSSSRRPQQQILDSDDDEFHNVFFEGAPRRSRRGGGSQQPPLKGKARPGAAGAAKARRKQRRAEQREAAGAAYRSSPFRSRPGEGIEWDSSGDDSDMSSSDEEYYYGDFNSASSSGRGRSRNEHNFFSRAWWDRFDSGAGFDGYWEGWYRAEPSSTGNGGAGNTAGPQWRSGARFSSPPPPPPLHSATTLAQLRVLGMATDVPFDGPGLKQAFHRCALRHHPDMHREPAAKAAAEAQFRAAKEAYEALQVLVRV